MLETIENNFSFTPGQRKSILFLLVLLCIGIACMLFYRRAYVPDEQLDQPAHAMEVADKIDVNTADWSTLAVLPLIGEKRAKEIISVREQLQIEHPDQPPFQAIEDLDKKVKGIGPTTIAKLRPFLLFPNDPRSTTRDASSK